MPVLTVGRTRIPYEVRESSKAKRKRIVVTPEKVEVVVPEGEGEEQAEGFIQSRRRWVYEQREDLQHRMERMLDVGPERLATGSKIAFRGRRVRLTVESGDCSDVEVRYRNGFFVRKGSHHSERDVGVALREWLLGRAKDDVAEAVRVYSPKLGLAPKGIRVFDMRRRWGSCGENGVLQINWRLVLAPKPVIVYAVVHELCHLRHRGHGEPFWNLLSSVLPEYGSAKEWLERNEEFVEGSARLGRAEKEV